MMSGAKPAARRLLEIVLRFCAKAWRTKARKLFSSTPSSAKRGAMRQPGELLSTWLLRASADPALADMRSRLQELLHLHYRYRFDPEGLSQPDREALRSAAAGCLARLA